MVQYAIEFWRRESLLSAECMSPHLRTIQQILVVMGLISKRSLECNLSLKMYDG